MTNPTNDIEALLAYMETVPRPDLRANLTALVAERDALKQRVAELEAQPSSELSFCERRDRAWAEELRPATPAAPVPQPPSDLRERLVCAALTGVIAGNYGSEYESAAIYAIRHANAALAAMRKGEA